MNKTATIFCLTLVGAIAFPIFYYAAFNFPADIAFAKKFGSRTEMALDQADFVQMRDGIITVWNEMNKTWQGENYEEIYSSWWPGDQTHVNTLAAQNEYFQSLTRRLNQTIDEKNSILNGTKTIMIPYSQWEQQTLEGFRNESKRAGGLLWVIRDAWYMRYAPNVAFWLAYFLPIEAILGIACFVSFLYNTDL